MQAYYYDYKYYYYYRLNYDVTTLFELNSYVKFVGFSFLVGCTIVLVIKLVVCWHLFATVGSTPRSFFRVYTILYIPHWIGISGVGEKGGEEESWRDVDLGTQGGL